MQSMLTFFKKLPIGERLKDLDLYLQKFSTHLKRGLEAQVVIREVLTEDSSLSC